MWADCSRASIAIASATASTGTQPRRSLSGIAARFAGVSIVLGSTAFTVTPWGPSSRARAWARAMTPNPPPGRLVRLEERARGEAADGPDQDVDATARHHGALDEGGHRRQIRDVHGLGHEAASVGGGGALAQLVALLRDRVRDGDDRALGEEPQRHRLAEGAGAAGHDRDAML